jgi:hypothetical protein
MFIARIALICRSVGAECISNHIAHGAPLERRIMSGCGYKHGAPLEHFHTQLIKYNHFSRKAPF